VSKTIMVSRVARGVALFFFPDDRTSLGPRGAREAVDGEEEGIGRAVDSHARPQQTQDSNPDVLSGKVQRFSGIGDCFRRVRAEQGVSAFWRGNLVNCLRYAPQQGSALAFNDLLNNMFPNYSSTTDFWKSFGVKLFSGGLAGAVANTICYPFDFARTRLASDVGKGKGQFNGIWDCISKTVRAQGITGLYTGWTVTVLGAFVYRAGQLGCFKQIQDLNPYAKDKGWKVRTNCVSCVGLI
jgi:solute carrier family 25 (adenine nucleotide translocator) protein 4/5/6/31